MVLEVLYDGNWLTVLKCTFVLFIVYTVTIYIKSINKSLSAEGEKFYSGARVLFVIAHPDDECMFFSPAIIHLCKTSKVFLLCSTTGNYYGKGLERKKELLKSCKILGIPESNVQILDDSAFPDDPYSNWDVDKLGSQLKKIVSSIKPSYIFTFDSKGVSGHPNHVAVSDVMKTLILETKFNHGRVQAYQLETVNFIRKYTSLLDLPFSLIGNNLTFISSPSEILMSQRAMIAHWSQMVWFRWLFIIFSRYMIINTFVPI